MYGPVEKMFVLAHIQSIVQDIVQHRSLKELLRIEKQLVKGINEARLFLAKMQAQ